MILISDDWQHPAATERETYYRLKNHELTEKKIFLHYPWATLIDSCHGNHDKAYSMLKALSDGIDNKSYSMTCCQHIRGFMYGFLFGACGITDVFWPHTTYATTVGPGKVKFHGYQLYPVQQPSSDTPTVERDLIASFTGAYDSKYYLTSARQWIGECNWGSSVENIHIKITQEWHFQKTVYQDQIGGKPMSSIDKEEAAQKEKQFRELLQRSVFSLCPSGSGPNSIRLWESIGFGSIPVVLADGLKMPEASSILDGQNYWRTGMLFIAENENSIKNLPSLLKDLASDKQYLVSARKSLSHIWDYYWRNSFVRPITDYAESIGLGRSHLPNRHDIFKQQPFPRRLHRHLSNFLIYASCHPFLSTKWPTGLPAIVDFVVEYKTGIRYEAPNINNMLVARCKESKGKNSYLVLAELLKDLAGKP